MTNQKRSIYNFIHFVIDKRTFFGIISYILYRIEIITERIVGDMNGNKHIPIKNPICFFNSNEEGKKAIEIKNTITMMT